MKEIAKVRAESWARGALFCLLLVGIFHTSHSVMIGWWANEDYTYGILYEVWGAQVAQDFFHGFSGWLIFMFALGVLLLEMGVLKKIFPEKKFSSVQGSRFKVNQN
jgi:hypothetical protein